MNNQLVESIQSIALTNSPTNNFVEEEGETLCAFIHNLIHPFCIPNDVIISAINTTLHICNNENDINLFNKLLNLFDFMGLNNEPLYQCVREFLPISILSMPTNPNIKILECITDQPYNDNMSIEMIKYCLPTIFNLRKHDFLIYNGYNFITKNEQSRKVIAYQLPYLQMMLSNGYVWNRDFSLQIAKAGNLKALKWLKENEYPLHTGITKYAAQGGYLHVLKWLDNMYDWDEEVCVNAVHGGHLHCIKYAQERGCLLTKEITYYATLSGHFNILQYAYENDCPLSDYAVSNALQFGHLDCLKYMIEKGAEWPEYVVEIYNIECLKYAYENGCSINRLIMSNFASSGNLKCIKYLYEHGCKWNEWTIDNAIDNGHFNVVKYAHIHGCPFGDHTCSHAIETKNIKMLKYVHKHGAPLNSSAWYKAVQHGIVFMEYLYEHNCPWDINTCVYAIKYDNFECLKFAQEHGAPPINKVQFYANTINKFIKNGNIEMLKYIHEHGVEYNSDMLISAVKYGQIDMLKYIHKEWKKPLRCYLYTIAIENKQIKCFQYLYSNNCPQYNTGFEYYQKAIYNGDLNFIIRLQDMGFVYNFNNIKCAAHHGHLHIVKYYYEHCRQSDDKLTTEVFSMAAISGNMELIIYLHDLKCPWNEQVLEKAVKYGHTKIVKYLYENGCPYSIDCSIIAASNGFLDIIMYFNNNNCHIINDVCEATVLMKRHACFKYFTQNIRKYRENRFSSNTEYYQGLVSEVNY